MTKDVLYIDVEDDITTIVGKIKASKEKIVAIVPPARYGVLQSAVNMRLLKRTADTAKKHIVLISSSQALASLAASADIPVAKNLQSKPEVAEVPVLKVDDNDIIDGNNLPVGEIAAATVAKPVSDKAVDELITSTAAKPAEAKAASKKKAKVPNFSTFRKKMFIFGGLGVLLLGFLVWAIWFAPRATVVITAKNTPVTIDRNIRLLVGGSTDFAANTMKALRQEQTADVSVEFSATGKKEVGERATGTVRFTSDSFSALLLGISIPAGTQLTSTGGENYTTDTAVTLSTSGNTKSVGITAVERGTRSNGASGSMSGAPSTVSAAITGGATTGGTDKTATVVSQEDVDKAVVALSEKKTEDLRPKLDASFSESNIVIKETFQEKRSDPVPSVKVDQEATGPVTLKATTTASMLAVDRSELEKFLKAGIQVEIEGMKSQKIYEDGSKDIKFSQFVDRDDGPTIRVTANGKIGPVIDEQNVKEQAAGKNYGDIQSSLESIDGVEDVDTKFWPFWVRTVPNNIERITVEFKIQDGR